MHTQEPIRVLIVDDQELVRAGFSMVIDSQADMHVVGQAAEGSQAVGLAQRLHPDVVLMDVRMPGMDGIEATRRISAMGLGPADERESDGQSDIDHGTRPDLRAEMSASNAHPADMQGIRRTTRVIILTTFDLDEYVMSAIRAGASGFLLKDTEPETLLGSIRTVYQGNAIIAPSATRRLIENMLTADDHRDHVASDGDAMAGAATRGTDVHHTTTREGQRSELLSTTGDITSTSYTDPELDDLTAREREVLVEIAHGLSNQEIADRLFISLPTVKTHVAHILAKINARDRVQAVVFAYENRLV